MKMYLRLIGPQTLYCEEQTYSPPPNFFIRGHVPPPPPGPAFPTPLQAIFPNLGPKY